LAGGCNDGRRQLAVVTMQQQLCVGARCISTPGRAPAIYSSGPASLLTVQAWLARVASATAHWAERTRVHANRPRQSLGAAAEGAWWGGRTQTARRACALAPGGEARGHPRGRQDSVPGRGRLRAGHGRARAARLHRPAEGVHPGAARARPPAVGPCSPRALLRGPARRERLHTWHALTGRSRGVRPLSPCPGPPGWRGTPATVPTRPPARPAAGGWDKPGGLPARVERGEVHSYSTASSGRGNGPSIPLAMRRKSGSVRVEARARRGAAPPRPAGPTAGGGGKR